jgi:glycerophosphoryl diester phosphodiesterase
MDAQRLTRNVAEFEDLVVANTGLDQRRGHVNHQTESRVATASLEKATQIGRQFHQFTRDSMNRFPRMQDIGHLEGDDVGVLPVIGVLDDIDGARGRLDLPDFVTQGEIDRGDPYLVFVERRDLQTPGGDLFEDDIACENRHGTGDDNLGRMPHPYFDTLQPVIIGHRGAAGTAPENTLAAFAAGLALGADVLESDIHATRDGVPVLIHDPDVNRTTDGTGQVEELTLDQLRMLDAGYNFSPDEGANFPKRGQGLRIPTLEEAFETFPDARFNLEIKANPPALVGRVIDLVEKFDRATHTLLTAGENPIMVELRRERSTRGSQFAIGASTADVLAVVKAAVENRPAPSDIMALQIPEAFGGRPLVTRELIAFAQDAEIAVHVWTINDPDDMHRLLSLGVDGLVTDHPERMAALLERM